jgi:hypothetical protein
MSDVSTSHTPRPAVPGHVEAAALGRPLPLKAAVRLMLVGTAIMLVFGSGPLRDFMTYLPLWMEPVDLWLMDVTVAWDDWMNAIGAAAPYQWIHDGIQELTMWGAPG